MASTTYLQQAYLAYFGRPADVSGLSFYADKTEAQVVAAFSASAESQAFFGSLNTLAQINTIYQNLFNRPAEPAGLTYWAGEINSGRLSLAQASMGILAGAQNADKLAVTNKLAAATAFTAALDTSAEMIGYQGSAVITSARAYLASVDSTAASLTAATATAALSASVSTVVAAGAASASSSSGTTFTLTTGIDNFAGTSGNDIFQGDSANIGGLDRIAGGAGSDTLNLTSTAAAVTLSSAAISDVEVLNFTAATAGHTVTLGGLTGITNVNNIGSTQALTVGVGANSLASLAAIGVTGTSTATTVVYQEAAVTGSADAVTVTVSGATGTINVDTETATATVAGAIETINLVSSGSTTNTIALVTNDTQGVGRVNVSGAAAITVALTTNLTTDAIVLDASAATGAVTFSAIGAGNNFAGTAVGHTITGGTAGDTFTFTAGYIGAEATVASGTRDVINGGNGTDRLNIVAADAVTASAAAQVNLTSIEALTISDGISGTQAFNITRFADVTALTLAATVNANYTGSITLNSGTAVTLGASADTNSTVTFVVGGTGVTDAMTLNTAGFSFLGTGTETFTGIEALTINTGATAVATSVFASATTLTQSAGSTSSTITASGVNGLTFTGVITGASLLDASALTGVLTVTAAAAAAITIRGGSGADVINGSASNDLITGGAGDDTLLGAAGDDTIQGGDGIDAITGGAGADTLTGGAGVDTFIFLASAKNASNGADGAAVAEVITDFVVGTDKLQFTTVTEVATDQAAVQAAVTALAANSTDAQIATAMAAANVTNLGLTFAVYAGSTYVYYETTGATATHVAIDNIFIKLTGVTTAPTLAADVTA